MKRLAVAFQPRRPDSEAAAASDVKKRAGFFSKAAPASPAQLHVPATLNTSSSSDSDGSLVQTPEPDDDPPPSRSTSRWSSWIKSKSSKPKALHVAAIWEHLSDSSSKHLVVQPSPPSTPDSPDSEDDSDHYDDELPLPPILRSPRHSPSHSPARSSRILQPANATLLRSQMNIRAITLGSIIPPISPPPLLHLPSGPLFPRSSNPARSLQPLQTTRTVLHKTIILRRLENQALTRQENDSIAPFGHRPKHVVPKTRRRGIDEEAMSDVKKVRYYSRGLQVWLDRPCFEERSVVWVWDPDRNQIVSRQIVGSDTAVASLEFSEGLETLAGYGLEPYSKLSAPVSLPSSKNTSFLEPLRITSPPPLEINSAGSSTPNASTGPSTPTTIATVPAAPLSAPPRKILRFLPDPDPEDDEDNIPLGFQILTKRESERIVDERERQVREEERMKKVYAAEVLAARARREGFRSGSMHDMAKERTKDRRSSYNRPAYDPSQPGTRRMASEPDTRPHPSNTPRAASSVVEGNAKSRPPSIRSERTGLGSSALRTPLLPSPPPPLRSQTIPTIEDTLEAKRRRPMSNLSEGGDSTRSRFSSAPTMFAPSPTHPRMLPRSYSSGSAVGGIPIVPVPVPVPPIPVMPMPVFIMPSPPQFFMQQMPYPSQAPLLPPIRPGLPVSRSAEGLVPPRSHHSGRQDSGGVKPTPSPRRSPGSSDIKHASRMSVQVPPVSFKQSSPNVSGNSTRTRPAPPSR